MFKDRQDAGRQLAKILGQRSWKAPLVLAMPKGGIPVAHEIAGVLAAPLEALVVRKLTSHRRPGKHFGAMSECDATALNEAVIQEANLSMEELHEILQDASHLLERRLALYRPDHHLPGLAGRSIILVDDFADSGWSARAALARIRHEQPLSVVLAVPLARRQAALELRPKVDELFCLFSPDSLKQLPAYYEDFRHYSDEEVLEMLRSHAQAHVRAA